MVHRADQFLDGLQHFFRVPAVFHDGIKRGGEDRPERKFFADHGYAEIRIHRGGDALLRVLL